MKLNALKNIESELSEVVEAMKTSPVFAQFTKDLSVPKETRLAAIIDLCGQARFSDLTRNFLCKTVNLVSLMVMLGIFFCFDKSCFLCELALLAENGKLKNLETIVKKFTELTTAHRGDVKVQVTTVGKLLCTIISLKNQSGIANLSKSFRSRK